MSQGKYEDLTNRRYHRLTVLGDTGERMGTHVLWRCKCRCGSIIVVPTTNLNTENTTSCGCRHRDICRGTPNHLRAQRGRTME